MPYGIRKITTRSSSTLDASSGMVSGNALSFGDETQALCVQEKKLDEIYKKKNFLNE